LVAKTSVATKSAAAAIQGGPSGIAARNVDFLALTIAHAVKLGAEAACFKVRLYAIAQVGKALLKVHAEGMEDVVGSGGDRVHFVHSAVPSI
jgi:hypothetical protein